jgi:hypothetical protein
MKKLADGFEVSARSYYYLLDWNDLDNGNYIVKEFGKTRIKELTRVEYKRMFNMATTREMNSW